MNIKEEREAMLEQINELTFKLLMTFNPGDDEQMLILDITDKVKIVKLELSQ